MSDGAANGGGGGGRECGGGVVRVLEMMVASVVDGARLFLGYVYAVQDTRRRVEG